MITNTHRSGRYRIRKEIVADPDSDLLLQRTRFEVLEGNPDDYHLYFLLAPHLGDEGRRNSASFGSYKGTSFLFAKSRHAALAISCSTGWKGRSAGYVGASDGWQDLSRHKRMLWHYNLAADGNVAVTGEVLLRGQSFVLAIGFGERETDAAYVAHAGLDREFDEVWTRYKVEWAEWQRTHLLPKDDAGDLRLFRASMAVLRVHESVEQPGCRVASLSIPWGEAREHQEAAGYHAVWARDCAQSALGLLACGAREDAIRTLDYLRRTQEADGHWPQVMWCDGAAYWKAIQLDLIAAPVLLYEIVRQENAFIGGKAASRYWPMLRRAAEFICRYGPISEQGRWERSPGFSIYTLAMTVAALVIAGQAARENHERELASYFLETADAWNAQIENWTYFSGSELAARAGVAGYYCRVVPGDAQGRPDFGADCAITNSRGPQSIRASEMVSPDVWALVRYGLRRADDPRVRDTTTAIDASLLVKTPKGPVWRRYNQDGYGETDQGEPFCDEGVGRAWPLLTGERAHYELAQGRRDEARSLARAMASFADESLLLSEQVWDAADIPDRGLRFGQATGSARPLAWAHAEYLQLLRSLHDGGVFSRPQVVSQRYVKGTA
ncbi:MAG TPA: glycoside hydrolase family 15 protein [Candidatus Methylacidiphilales bacterium]|nr:glycoside hydrolase family 15 protein [Candidatus Methylacidiphilales bacterium]